MRDLFSLYNRKTDAEQDFDSISIGIASPRKFARGPMVRLRSRKQLIIGHLSQNAMVCFAQSYLARLVITNVYAVNTNV